MTFFILRLSWKSEYKQKPGHLTVTYNYQLPYYILGYYVIVPNGCINI